MIAPRDSRVRIDVWLWAARFFRTRLLAKAAIESGKVRIAGEAVKPGRHLNAGERVEVTRGDAAADIEVLALATARGPAAVAQGLYRETDASVAKRLAAREARRLANAGYAEPPTKPDKRARRLLLKLLDSQ